MRLWAELILIFAAATIPSQAQILSLKECLQLAEDNNPELKAHRSQVEAKESGIRSAFAGFLPKLDLESSVKTDETRSLLTRSIGTSRVLLPGSLSMSTLLYDFGKTNQNYRKAIHESLASRHALQSLLAQVFLNVKTAFIGLLKAQQVLKVSDQTLAQREKFLQVTGELYEAGLRPRSDVLRAKIDLSNAGLERIDEETKLKLQWENLKTAVGVWDLPQRPLENILTEQEVSVDESKALRLAQEARPEILNQKEQVEIQKRLLGLVKREFAPTLEGSSSFFFRRSALSGAFQGYERGWSLGVASKLNLFSGFGSSAGIQRERAGLLKNLEELNALQLKVANEVKEALFRVSAEARKLKIAQEIRGLAEENENLVWEYYRSGKGTLIQVTDAQSQLLSARLSDVNSLADYHLALARLERAVGGPVESLISR